MNKLNKSQEGLEKLIGKNSDEIFDSKEAAKFLQMCTKTLYSCIKQHGLKAHPAPKEYRFLKSEIIEWTKKRRN